MSTSYDVRHIKMTYVILIYISAVNARVSEVNMLMPCEVAVRSLVPSIRSAIAKELTEAYGLKQRQVASLLGVTQTAVSKYTRGVRGTVLSVEEVEEVQPIVKETVVLLANGNISRYELAGRFCEICQIIRRKRLLCEFCKRSDPSIDIHKCFVCMHKR